MLMFAEMYVNVVFVIRCLYSAVSLIWLRKNCKNYYLLLLLFISQFVSLLPPSPPPPTHTHSPNPFVHRQATVSTICFRGLSSIADDAQNDLYSWPLHRFCLPPPSPSYPKRWRSTRSVFKAISPSFFFVVFLQSK